MRPTLTQRQWLKRGLRQPGGKLPLFNEKGQQIGEKTVRACIKAGWATPWKQNPIMPEWLICRITMAGKKILEEKN